MLSWTPSRAASPDRLRGIRKFVSDGDLRLDGRGSWRLRSGTLEIDEFWRAGYAFTWDPGHPLAHVRQARNMRSDLRLVAYRADPPSP